jgi:3'(2'), 5'-bisphosphate nucleotidase
VSAADETSANDANDADGTNDANDHALATRLAVEAGRLLVELRAELTRRGTSSWQIMDTGDLAAHRFLMSELRRARPGDAVLSEEGADDRRRLSAERVWIVDPLDGTNEFGERGRSDWAVHVALWERGELTAGAVSLPALELVFSSEPAPVLAPVERDRPRLITSRNRAPYAAVVIANELGADAVRLGSAGAKAMAVVVGEADIYAHDGGMYQWDSAAPAVVAKAAGLHVSRIDGSPLEYNRPDPWLPDLLICRPELADEVLGALWGHLPRGEWGRRWQ